MPLTLPTIHRNGSSAESLREEYLAAYMATNAAIEAIQKVDFNQRDYYPVEGSWEKARAEHIARLQTLKTISDELMTITEHCDSHTTR